MLYKPYMAGPIKSVITRSHFCPLEMTFEIGKTQVFSLSNRGYNPIDNW